MTKKTSKDGCGQRKSADKKVQKKCRHFGAWLPDQAHVDRERSVGVTVSNCVVMGGFSPPVVVTIEIYGLGTAEEKDEDSPETWGGSESATLTPDGARELAAMLMKHAEQAEALQREDRSASQSKRTVRKDG